MSRGIRLFVYKILSAIISIYLHIGEFGVSAAPSTLQGGHVEQPSNILTEAIIAPARFDISDNSLSNILNNPQSNGIIHWLLNNLGYIF